ncbi:MAG: hypothetical protein A2889_10410 [Nitrospinae bacterium RIFCSPLOWO2_01_FULL_39_10]|nr:MAG: hypothetical protein A2889_10410 [Nitrospinae bacterium RIFCSPLOWO2_01_FULL_39_10]
METGNSGVITKGKNTKFIVGLIFLIISFTLYFCIPLLVIYLPYDKKLLGGIALYIVSWGLTGIAIYFMGKEGYNLVKSKVFSIFKRKK